MEKADSEVIRDPRIWAAMVFGSYSNPLSERLGACEERAGPLIDYG